MCEDAALKLPRGADPGNTEMLLRLLCAAAVMVSAAIPTARPAGALSAALARQCLALTMQEYPRPKGYAAYKPGDPGTAKARESYYRACIAKALAQGTATATAPSGQSSAPARQAPSYQAPSYQQPSHQDPSHQEPPRQQPPETAAPSGDEE